MRPYNQILHWLAGKIYFISSEGQLAQFDPVTLRSELLGMKNLESLDTCEGRMGVLTNDGELTLLYQNADPKNLHISRPYKLFKIAISKSYIIVVGWDQTTSSVHYLLYDPNLEFKDEIRLKSSNFDII